MRRTTASLARGAMVLLCCFVVAGTLSAADDNTVISPRSAARAEAPAATAASSLNSMSLLLALALAGAGGWMVWKNRRRQAAGRDLRALAVEETRSLGNRQYLVVASYEGRKFLLGVCPGRIDLLSALDGAPAESSQKSRE